MNVVLAGMPGCGKSTLLNYFKNCGYIGFDTDEEIVKKYGDIPKIFENYGEEYFRKLETRTVKMLSKLQSAVIATGGGCLMRSENVEAFKKTGKIFYLKTDLITLLARVGNGEGRPLLKGDTEAKLKRLYEIRTPVFENVSDIILECGGLAPAEIAGKIINLTGI